MESTISFHLIFGAYICAHLWCEGDGVVILQPSFKGKGNRTFCGMEEEQYGSMKTRSHHLKWQFILFLNWERNTEWWYVSILSMQDSFITAYRDWALKSMLHTFGSHFKKGQYCIFLKRRTFMILIYYFGVMAPIYVFQ